MGDYTPPFVTISSRQPTTDGNSFSSGDSAVRRDNRTARSSIRPPQARSRLITSSAQYGSSVGDEKTPSATHDISRVNYHVRCLPEFARTLEDVRAHPHPIPSRGDFMLPLLHAPGGASAARAFPNQRGGSQRYKKVFAILLHWKCDDLFVLPELQDLECCFREDFDFETETFPIPSDNAHLELMLRIGAMIKEHESNDTLFIVYYGGHARIDESRQSTWCATRGSDSPWLQWSAIQTLLERSLSDVLILLDCCAGAASATFPNGNSITETISASSWDAIAPDPGRYSFTNALIEVLQEWKRRSFSAAMLHAEVLARLKHPRPIMLNGKHFEARSTPVHFMMTANHRAPSIEMSRIVPADRRPPSPPQESAFDPNSLVGRSAGPQDVIGSEPNEDVPHVMISLALEDDQRLNINDWEHWLSSIPAIAKYVKVQGVFKSHSTLLLLSLPVMVWDLLPENHACNFVAFIRSNNLAMECPGEPQGVAEEVPTGADIDADLRSIYSGTTAYTAAPVDWAGGVRLSTISSFSNGKAPMDPIYRNVERPRYSSHSNAPPTSTEKPPRGWPGLNLGAPIRKRTATVGSIPKSMSNDSLAQQKKRRNSTRIFMNSIDDLPSRSHLAPHVQARLEEYFHTSPRPTMAVKEFLASNLGIETSDIEIWFYHRREQQEVSNRLQSLKIDDHSHDPPKDGAQMILPGHLNTLLEIFPPTSRDGGSNKPASDGNQIVLIDLRPAAEYDRSHIHGAINLRVPASFVARADLEMIERALPDDASRTSFSQWGTSKCIVFYDKVVEYAWEAPVADALFRKFRGKGWAGQCFLLKGHYREFSQSFDRHIVVAGATENAGAYLTGLAPGEKPGKNKTDDHQRYAEWHALLEGEDRVHSTDLVPSIKDERVRALVQHQKAAEDDFERAQPALYRQGLARQPEDDDDNDWALRTAPMVEHLERGIAKMQAEVSGSGPGGSGRSSAGGGRSGDSPSEMQLGYRGGYPTVVEKPSLLGVEDYDLLESEDEYPHPPHAMAPPTSNNNTATSGVRHEPGFQKLSSASASGSESRSRPSPHAEDAAAGPEKKGRSGLGGTGRNLLTKIIRSGRHEPPR
ncbi:Uu.00g003130.m01.CDS01 [Anthostomella pinea]|uniref:Uu.00g003130.m01.CDS01 n=1 Tax=Anthostomella pinea TaxID=933095 RepID=A0AAI8YIT5_9PEZI|nr:Uu.00g003130.m01.CDS01 [Anthostomella pinea]